VEKTEELEVPEKDEAVPTSSDTEVLLDRSRDPEFDHPLFSQRITQSDDATTPPGGPGLWDTRYFTTTSVIVGHVLHRTQSDAVAVTSTPSIGSMRFIPPAINVSKVFGRAQQDNIHQRSSIVMNFRPSPWTTAGAQALKDYPMIEMRFNIVPDTRCLELKDVFALAEVAISDVMIPDRDLDLRFQQRTTSRLRHRHKLLPSVKKFLETAELDLKQTIRTPPSIILPIDQHLCGSSSANDSVPSTDEPINVQYLFTGWEWKKILAVPFENWRLLYTSVGDAHGKGQRAELSLRPRRSGQKNFGNKELSSEWEEDTTRDFIETAYRLVDVLGDTSPEIRKVQSKLVKLTPSNATYPLEEDGSLTPFRYFAKRITFTGRPKDDESTTDQSEDSEDLDDELNAW
jgi:hypothetical protein